MRWELINATPEHEIYHLYDEDRQLLTLELNPFSNSARVQCNEEKRIFLVRREGFRRHKTIIRSEYGVKLGEVGSENGQSFIDVNDERLHFTSPQHPGEELILYRDSKDQPIVSCSVSAKKGSAGINFSKDKSLAGMPHPGLLMALCWYMYLPAAKQLAEEVPA